MLYSDFVEHLHDQGCKIVPDTSSSDGDYFRNCVNNEMSYVSRVEKFSVPTIIHIVMELGIAPPYKFEDDYEVYKTFRKRAEQILVLKKQK